MRPVDGEGKCAMHISVGRVAKALEHRAPRFPACLRVVVDAHADLGIARLERRMDHVARDQGILSRLPDVHREMIDRVSGRRDELNQIVQARGRSSRARRAWPATIGSTKSLTQGWLAGSFLLRPVRQLAVGKQVLAFGNVGTQRPFSSRVFQPT